MDFNKFYVILENICTCGFSLDELENVHENLFYKLLLGNLLNIHKKANKVAKHQILYN